MRFIDTNVSIRFIIRDENPKTQTARELFRRVRDGLAECVTCELVVAEIVYVLRFHDLYHLTSVQIRDTLWPLLTLSGLRLVNRAVYLQALDLIVEHLLLRDLRGAHGPVGNIRDLSFR